MLDDHSSRTDALLRQLVDQSKEYAIIILDPGGRIASWNRGAEAIFGISRAEAVGQHASSLFTPEDVERGIPDHELVTAAADAAAENDRWMERPNGSRFWATGVMRALRDEDGRTIGFGKILRNRTALREQVETLRNQLDACEATHRRKDLFLSTLSHELRNPLAPLCSAVQLIRVTAPSAPEMEYSLKIIERQVENMRRLVDDLLDVTRIHAGKVDLKLEAVALQEILHRVMESVGPFARARRHRLEVLMPPVPIIVDADPYRLEQVFVNLVNNAAKYTPEGGSIWIKGTIEGDEAVVHVEDTGIGIPHEMLPRIFELFTQVESSLEQSQGGLGIGLSVVKELVTLHGGSVQVSSEGPGKGSVFSVRLPLSFAQE